MTPQQGPAQTSPLLNKILKTPQKTTALLNNKTACIVTEKGDVEILSLFNAIYNSDFVSSGALFKNIQRVTYHVPAGDGRFNISVLPGNKLPQYEGVSVNRLNLGHP